MKQLTTDFLNLLISETPTLARCWKITNKNTSQGFTNFTQDLVIEGLTYKASLGFNPTDIESSVDGDPYNMELTSILSEEITSTELKSGLYDYAAVNVFLVNFLDLPTTIPGNAPYNYLPLFNGQIGKIRFTEDSFTVEVLSKAQLLQGQYNWVTSKTCRYRFGDNKCGINLETKKDTNSVESPGGDSTHFTSNVAKSDDFYTGSSFKWIDGDNVGLTSTVVKSNGKNIFTFSGFPNPLQAGDQFEVYQQCNKSTSDCKYYNNYSNFGGEPNLPGLDAYYSNEPQ